MDGWLTVYLSWSQVFSNIDYLNPIQCKKTVYVGSKPSLNTYISTLLSTTASAVSATHIRRHWPPGTGVELLCNTSGAGLQSVNSHLVGRSSLHFNIVEISCQSHIGSQYITLDLSFIPGLSLVFVSLALVIYLVPHSYAEPLPADVLGSCFFYVCCNWNPFLWLRAVFSNRVTNAWGWLVLGLCRAAVLGKGLFAWKQSICFCNWVIVCFMHFRIDRVYWISFMTYESFSNNHQPSPNGFGRRYLQELALSSKARGSAAGADGAEQPQETVKTKHVVDFSLEALIDFQNSQRLAETSKKPDEPLNFRRRPNYDNTGRKFRMKQSSRISCLDRFFV